METTIFGKYIINTKKCHLDFAIIRVTNTETDDMYIGMANQYSCLLPELKNQTNLTVKCNDECFTIIIPLPFNNQYRCEIMKYREGTTNNSSRYSVFLMEDNKILTNRIGKLEEAINFLTNRISELEKANKAIVNESN